MSWCILEKILCFNSFLSFSFSAYSFLCLSFITFHHICIIYVRGVNVSVPCSVCFQFSKLHSQSQPCPSPTCCTHYLHFNFPVLGITAPPPFAKCTDYELAYNSLRLGVRSRKVQITWDYGIKIAQIHERIHYILIGEP